ncbi:hypothetical protein B0H63DRAFT_183149 [Podospora didyma]|uniref:DUF1993 domain-containing protein n=1 Tax=Podospora didyma TaxID=330526 RepID=A0AAE0NPS6_9PEZI|nr:hypothetical protein B0H63DRAFT_183149 [Podospora didyma]
MASLSLYDASIKILISAHESLVHILQKASEHPDAASFPATRLYEDMLPLSFQVQIASNIALKTAHRLTAGKLSFDAFADDEKTIDELIARADKTLALLRSVNAEDLPVGVEAVNDTKSIELAMGPKTFSLTPAGYAFGFGLPNVFFHVSTAYGILRSKGVPLGKMDFLQSFMAPQLA